MGKDFCKFRFDNTKPQFMKKIFFSIILTSLIGLKFGTFISLAQESLNLLIKLDKGLPPSGLNASSMGEVVASLGDVNGDGYDDWAVGFPQTSDYETGQPFGKVYVYFGGGTIQSNDVPGIILEGVMSNSSFGAKIIAVGDVNHDGFSDFLVSGNRQIELFLGGKPMDNLPDLILPIESYLISASIAGDINNDGFDDFMVSMGKSVSIYFGGSNINSKAGVVFHGFQENDRFGGSVSNIGDINKDGFGDIIIGADGGLNNTQYSGKAYLYLGGAEMDTVPDMILCGKKAGDRFGSIVSGARDLNQDGFADWIVTEGNNQDLTGISRKVSVYFGGELNDTIPDLIINGQEVYPAGDIDKDGFDDLIVDWSVFRGGNPMDNVADYLFPEYCRVAAGGDFNNDGFTDLIIGQPNDSKNGYGSGSASIFYGKAHLASDPDVVFYGAQASEYFGSSVAGVGDINNDGFSDFIIGAHGNSKHGFFTGASYLYLGGDPINTKPIFSFFGQKSEVQLGYSASSAGDVNNDGFADFIIGGFATDYANLYLGSPVIDSIPDFVFKGKNQGAHFGNDVSSAGDFNHDGYDDILIGEFCNSEKDIHMGRAYLYFGGPNMNTTPDLTFEGEEVFNNFGQKVACAGDLNGDGFSDIMIGAPRWDRDNLFGRLYIFYGGLSPDTIPDLVITGNKHYGQLGSIIATAGDVNMDGYDDIIVGVPFYGNSPFGISYVNIYYGGAVMDTVPDVKIEKMAYGFGSGVGSAGDLNNDGFDDIMIGGGWNQVELFFGGKAMDTSVDMIIKEEISHMLDFGSNISFIGDANRDGYTDILIGYPYSNAVGHSMGRAYIYSNPIKTGTQDILEFESRVQVFPNPFSSEVTIRYVLKERNKVQIYIYNALGQKVETLVNKIQQEGEHQFVWQPENLPNGIYFCKVQAQDFSETKKVIFQK